MVASGHITMKLKTRLCNSTGRLWNSSPNLVEPGWFIQNTLNYPIAQLTRKTNVACLFRFIISRAAMYPSIQEVSLLLGSVRESPSP